MATITQTPNNDIDEMIMSLYEKEIQEAEKTDEKTSENPFDGLVDREDSQEEPSLLLERFDHIRSDPDFHDLSADMLKDIPEVSLSFEESQASIPEHEQSGISKGVLQEARESLFGSDDPVEEQSTLDNAQGLVLGNPDVSRPRGDSFDIPSEPTESSTPDASEAESDADTDVETEEDQIQNLREQVAQATAQIRKLQEEGEEKDMRLQRLRKRQREQDQSDEESDEADGRPRVVRRLDRVVRRGTTNVMRFDEDGEEQTGGNWIKNSSDELVWSPPFGRSFDGLLYCHDPDCRRSFTEPRTLKMHIWGVGNKYKEETLGRAGHNAENDPEEQYLTYRDGREFISRNWDPYHYCSVEGCNERRANRKNLLLHAKKHIDAGDLIGQAREDYIKRELDRIVPLRKKGNWKRRITRDI